MRRFLSLECFAYEIMIKKSCYAVKYIKFKYSDKIISVHLMASLDGNNLGWVFFATFNDNVRRVRLDIEDLQGLNSCSFHC